MQTNSPSLVNAENNLSKIGVNIDFSQLQFCDCKSQIDFTQLQQLFKVGAFWAQNRKIEDMTVAISNSEPVISVWAQERLIGFARATSDGVYRATIWDVVVHPEYQGAGIGRKLLETILNHPRINSVERVYLMTTYQQGFYTHLGFESSHPSTTMVRHNRHFISSQFAQAMKLQE